MSSPASIAGHPLHPMLVPLPIGLWVFSFVADLVALSTGGGSWPAIAFYTMLGGLVGAVLAAIPGLIDFTAVHAAPVRRVAILHLVLNLCLVILYSVNLWLRWDLVSGRLPLLLSALGILALGFSGWLGGELVFVRRVGVASPNSPPR